jgi:hypothetical protein
MDASGPTSPFSMNQELSKEQKVLLALFRLWSAGKKKVRYEDVVVRAFKDYPADFHLKGYTQYPDSGDAVHKPLYDYRKRGMVSASHKMFSLTPHGVTEAQRLEAAERGKPAQREPRHRLERDAEIEIERIRGLESFKLFCAGKKQEIIDADLFDYLGVSVRTGRNDFIGRLETMKAAVAALLDTGREDALLNSVQQFHEYIMSRFAAEIAFKSGHKAPHGGGPIPHAS